jgi:hypothetical protein
MTINGGILPRREVFMVTLKLRVDRVAKSTGIGFHDAFIGQNNDTFGARHDINLPDAWHLCNLLRALAQS